MFKRNLDVREAKGRIPMWVIAERLEVSEGTLLNWMKKEMGAERKYRVLAAIAEIKSELEEYGVTKIVKDSEPDSLAVDA